MLSHRALLANLEQCLALEPDPDGRGRRGAAGAAAVPHLRAQHRAGHGGRHGGDAGCWSSGSTRRGTAALVRRRGRDQHPRRAADVRRLGGSRRPTTSCAASGCWRPGRRSLPPAVLEQVQTAVGITIHEGYGLTETAPVVTSTLASPGRQGRVDRPADPRRRGAAGRRGRRRRPRRRRRRDLGPRREPVLGLLAGRQRRPGRRTAGGRPATSRTPTTTATCSSSTGARSWSWSAASTSTRARSRTRSPSTRTSPRSP